MGEITRRGLVKGAALPPLAFALEVAGAAGGRLGTLRPCRRWRWTQQPALLGLSHQNRFTES